MEKFKQLRIPVLTDTKKNYRRIFKQYPNAHLDQAKSIQEIHKLVPELIDYLNAPETVHALSVFRDDCIVYNLTIRSATFEKTFLDALPKDSILSLFFKKSLYQSGEKSCLYFKKPQDYMLQKLILEMHNEMKQQNRYYGTLLNAMLAIFFIQLLRKYEKNILFPNSQQKKPAESLIFILKYIDNNYKTVTLKELSSFFGYSERQMIRILKAYTGENFSSLIRSVKLSKACELLKHPDIRLSDIINEVGYSNASHFCDSFRMAYGITPSEYRRQNKPDLSCIPYFPP